MAKVVAGMTISLDGYVADPGGSVAALYSDFAAMHEESPLIESIQATGAVVMGKNAFAMAEDPDWYAGNYEYQVPIFVLTHTPPPKHPKETPALTFTFVTDGIESAIRQAKAAAGTRDVTVIGGATTIRQVVQAGLADELSIDIMPVLLGGGLRLFEPTGAGPIILERLWVRPSPGGRTSLLYRFLP
ncbi:MAG TPA: dihydrofolate reductase family protein [Anaerolinea sp.]|nr:dihydrofolate reductase family protein [Anaerolinea sp.]